MTALEKSLPSSYNAEGRLADLGSSLAVVVTHPWGPLGGNYHNNVVHAVVSYFQKLGCTTLRFNFQGSQIGFGSPQVNQMRGICEKLLAGNGCEKGAPRKLLLVGYSYGSLISTSASADLGLSSVMATVSIAPPFGVQHWLLLFQSSHHMKKAAAITDMPRLFIMGDQDNFTSVDTFSKTVERDFATTVRKEARIIENVDHFFHRQEGEAVKLIGEWLLSLTGVEDLGQLATLYNT